jgi:hypothetical protein
MVFLTSRLRPLLKMGVDTFGLVPEMAFVNTMGIRLRLTIIIHMIFIHLNIIIYITCFLIEKDIFGSGQKPVYVGIGQSMIISFIILAHENMQVLWRSFIAENYLQEEMDCIYIIRIETVLKGFQHWTMGISFQ